MFNELVSYDWEKLERQPMYVKSERVESKKHGWRIELAIDRKCDNPSLRGEVFYVYGKNIDPLNENDDVMLVIDKENSTFIRGEYGSTAFIMCSELTKKNDI